MKYVVLQPVKIAGRRQEAGAELNLSERTGSELAKSGVLMKLEDAKATKQTQAQLDALAAQDAAYAAAAAAAAALADSQAAATALGDSTAPSGTGESARGEQGGS